MKKIITLIRIIFILIIGVGCTTSTKLPTLGGLSTKAIIASPTATLSLLPTPAITSKPTQTEFQPATPTITARVTPTPIPTFSKPMDRHCIDITENRDSNWQLEGSLILNQYGVENPAYMLFLKSTDLMPILQGELRTTIAIAVSPNRKFLIVDGKSDSEKNEYPYILLDGNGKYIQVTPIKKNWGIKGWLDSENIVAVSDWAGKPNEWAADLTIIVNPFTNTLTEFAPIYPDFFYGQLWWWDPVRTVYDPTLKRVLYPAEVNRDSYADDIVLWDVLNAQALARIPALFSSNPEPVWSSDGEFAILLGLLDPNENRENHEFLLVQRDGVIKRLTSFSDQPPLESFSSLALSPDNRKVAFWVWDNVHYLEELAILDISSGKVINTCVGGDFTQTHHSGGPFWSPDGKYLIIEQILDINQSQIVIVDVEKEKALVVVENMRPVGWMAESP